MTTTSLYETTPQSGTVSSTNLTSLYSNTGNFTAGVVNSSVYSVNGGVGVTVNPTTGNVVVNIGQDVATTADVTFATANLNDTAVANNTIINPLTINAVAGSGITPTAGYGVGILAQATLTNGSQGSLGRLNWESQSVSPGDNDSTFNVYTYENNTEYNVATISTNGAYFKSQIQLAGETSGYVSLNAGFTPSPQTYTLPQAYPANNNYVLVSQTDGTMSWVAGSSVSGVSSITGTTNQINVSSPTGAVTLSTPQDIATTSNPTFAGATLGNVRVGIADDNTIDDPTSDLIIGNFTDITYRPVVNSGASSPVAIQRRNSTTNTNIRSLALIAQSTGTPTVGFGNSLEFQVETTAGSPGNIERAGYVSVTSTDLTAGSEDFKMSFGLMQTGATSTEKASLDSAGNFIADGYVAGTLFYAGGIGIFDASGPFTTSTTAANQVASTISSTTYRSVKYQYQITSGTAYQAVEIMIIHDGTTAYLNTYSDLRTGANLSTFNADISGGNIRLLVTPTNAVTTYKGIVTAVTV